jgi:hypothetical protein
MESVDVRRGVSQGQGRVASTHNLIGAHELYTSSWPHPLYACVRARGMGLSRPKQASKKIVIMHQVIFFVVLIKEVPELT